MKPEKRQSSVPGVEYLGGIHLSDSILWMDAPRRADLCFISHAHFSRPATHGKVLVTKETAKLAADLLRSCSVLVCPYYRRFSLGGLDMVLHPAGHILGAAQLLVTISGQRVVYASQLRSHDSRLTQKAYPIECEVLILDSTGARSQPSSTSPAVIIEQLLGWVDHVGRTGATSVLFTQPLGQAQELLVLLTQAGLRVDLHDSIYRCCKVYQELGVDVGPFRRHRASVKGADVVLYPRRLLGVKSTLPTPHTRLAYVGSNDPEIRLPETVETRFNLSSLADLAELVSYAQACKPRRIYVVGRHADYLAQILRESGMHAWPLSKPQQMDFFRKNS